MEMMARNVESRSLTDGRTEDMAAQSEFNISNIFRSEFLAQEIANRTGALSPVQTPQLTAELPQPLQQHANHSNAAEDIGWQIARCAGVAATLAGLGYAAVKMARSHDSAAYLRRRMSFELDDSLRDGEIKIELRTNAQPYDWRRYDPKADVFRDEKGNVIPETELRASGSRDGLLWNEPIALDPSRRVFDGYLAFFGTDELGRQTPYHAELINVQMTRSRLIDPSTYDRETSTFRDRDGNTVDAANVEVTARLGGLTGTYQMVERARAELGNLLSPSPAPADQPSSSEPAAPAKERARKSGRDLLSDSSSTTLNPEGLRVRQAILARFSNGQLHDSDVEALQDLLRETRQRSKAQATNGQVANAEVERLEKFLGDLQGTHGPDAQAAARAALAARARLSVQMTPAELESLHRAMEAQLHLERVVNQTAQPSDGRRGATEYGGRTAGALILAAIILGAYTQCDGGTEQGRPRLPVPKSF